MKNNFQSKAVPRGTRTIWRYLSALFLLFTLGIGNVWGANTPASAGEYSLVGKKPGGENKFYKLGDGVYIHRKTNSSWDSSMGMKIPSTNDNGVAVYLSSSMKVSALINKKSDKNAVNVELKAYPITNGSTTFDALEAGTDNSTTVAVTIGSTASYTLSTSFAALSSKAAENKSTNEVTFVAGYYYIVGTDDKGTTYLTSVTLAAASATAPAITAPTTDQSATYTVGDVITALEVTATGSPTPTYQWYYNSSASTEGATSLGSSAQTASYTPSNAAASDLYYYCVVSNSAGSATSHYFHVTVNTPSSSTHAITYNEASLKGADVSAYPTEFYEGIGIASFDPLADVTDFHFNGWSPASIGTDVATDVEMTATWVAAYDVTFNINGGTGSAPDAFQKWEGATFELPGQGSMVAPSGRVFGGWKAGGTKYAASAEYTMTNAAVEFVAQWDLLVEQVLYSWEGAEGGATEVGGTATHYNADAAVDGNPRVNYKTTANSVDYYTISLNGKADYSTDHIRIALTANAKAGDKVKMTAFYSKDSEKTVAPKIANSTNAELVTGSTPPNIYSSGVPALQTVILPVGADEAELRLTRSTTATNVFITKLQIVHEKAVPEEDIRTVTFNTNGGSAIAAVSVEKGTAVAQPADPTKAHCRFEGWQLSGSDYDFSSAVNSNITLDAVWTQLYTISFAAGDGSGDAPAAIADKAKDETFEVPANTFTAPASKEFDKWNDGSADYAPGATYTVGTANVVLTAQWKAVTAKYTVIFKDGETTLDTKLFEVGSNPSDADIDKTKPLFAFAAWQKDAADIALDDAYWATVVKDASVTLTARWTKAYATSYDMEAYAASVGASKVGLEAALTAANYAFTNINGIDNEHTHNYTYDGMKYKTTDGDLSFNVLGGKVVEVKTGHLPSNDAVIMNINGVADATVFEGADEASETHKANYFYSAVEALYRLDVLASKGTCAVKAVTIRDPFTVSFEAHGDADPSALQGLPSVTLPDATNGTASLLGWFTEETGGTKIGDAGDTYIPTANITLHAQWESISTDARLASITFSSAAGTLEPAFDPEVVDYTYTMPYPTAAVPTITGATSVSAKAKTPVIDAQAANWGDVAHIHGVAESDDTKDYYITMKIAPKDGVSIITATLSGESGKAATCTVTGLIGGTAAVNLSNMKSDGGAKLDNGKSFGITLAEGTFQAGDVVNVNITTAAGQGTFAVWADNACSELIVDAGVVGVAGSNKVVLPAAVAGKSTIYLARTDAVNNWNPQLNVFEVLRPMNPMLTAITIDGRDGEIDALDDKHFSVTIPYEAVLSSLTVVPTIVRNAAHPTTPEAVISNEGAWILGDNTYRIMDKDGDYTDYTITLDRDVLKHTVSFNTHGGTAIDPVLVAHGEYLAAAPSDPEKEDYIFQHWSLSDGGAAVDVTTVQINEDKEFHAVWVADGAIKLLDGSTVNHTNFITAVTADETVEFQGNTVNYAKFSGTCSGVNSVKDLTRVIAYNATTNKTKIRISAHNNSTSARSILVKGLVEGASAAEDLATIALANKEDKVSDWIEFDNAANRTIYIMVSSSAGDVYFTQVKVVESGETPMKQAGEAGYSLNLNKGRFFGTASTDLAFEGLNARLSGDYTALNSGYAKLNATSMSFTVASDMNLVVTTNNSKTYYVTKGAAGTDNETAKTGVSEFDLTAGTWFITAGASEVQFTNLAFELPKCEKPAFNALVNSDLCSGDPYVALDGTGSVTDGGTITYKWYAEGGTDVLGTNATYTPAADGNYYVVALHHVDGFTDNEATSDVVTVQHLAATAITTAPKDQRVDAGQNATLSVVASGKAPLTYQWYTCDDETGANPVIIDGAESDSYVVAVTSGFSQYYKVVVSSGCGEASAVAKVEEWTELPQLDVTASMTWDWTYAGENNKLVTGKNVEIVMANIRENDKIPTNDATFRSQALLFYGENVRATEGGRNYASIGHIAFHTTVPGVVIVEFSDNGSNNRRVSINGKLSEASAAKTDVKTFSANVPAGDVTIMGVEEDGSGSNKYIRISKIEFVKVDYTRPVTAGRLGTICLPNGGKMYGAGLYEIAYFDATAKKIFFDEIINGEMIAGRPYIFLPNEGVDLLAVAYTDNADADAGNYKGLYGSYTQEELGTDGSNYILLNNQYCRVVEAHTYVGANRAYIKLGEIGTTPYAAAPGRRRISMGVTGENQAQGFENLQSGDAPMKVMIDGTLYIIRGEKVFDATGRLVK